MVVPPAKDTLFEAVRLAAHKEHTIFTTTPTPETAAGRVSAEHQQLERILVEDDNVIKRQLLCNMLNALDVQVELAENGVQVVEACRKSRFCFILVNVRMPVMSWIEASRVIRSGGAGLGGEDANQTTPINAFTASATMQGSNDVLDDAGISGLLVKPITRRGLFGMAAR